MSLQSLIDDYRFGPSRRRYLRLLGALSAAGPVRSHGKDVWWVDGSAIRVSAPPDDDGLAATITLGGLVWAIVAFFRGRPPKVALVRLGRDYATIPDAREQEVTT